MTNFACCERERKGTGEEKRREQVNEPAERKRRVEMKKRETNRIQNLRLPSSIAPDSEMFVAQCLSGESVVVL